MGQRAKTSAKPATKTTAKAAAKPAPKPVAKADGKIVVSKNGPYIVTGQVPLSVQTIVPNKQGESWDWKEGKKFQTGPEYHLCRCGHSSTKPFCDGTHVKIGFDGIETANRVPYERQAEKIDGPAIELRDAEELCAFARFCDAGGKIWNLIGQSEDPRARELAIREANHCPAGRLVVHDKKTGKPIEEKLEQSIGVVEDPALGCSGPLWARGGIPIESSDGRPRETRNRVALCRCGASDNKPFCNGSHASMKFKDGIV
ncbi:MAG TPA: CDGSH iron-sulfur domain-containing protein [Planctomycetota bacterium]|nr:CDGSH iron-sulfur domain-containing protein [Planctomycetota bacterium]